MTTRRAFFWLSVCSTLLTIVNAANWPSHIHPGDSDPKDWPSDTPDDSNSPDSVPPYGYNFSFGQGQRTLIAHAVIAAAVWIVLIPAAGLLLRFNIRSPWILRLHAALQIFSYILYVVAVGLGIWLVNNSGYSGLWSDAHPRLGLAILVLATFQPVLGAIHNRIFNKRVANIKAGNEGPAPGRTILGWMHIWLGRTLIILGIINGGLGLRLASQSISQNDVTSFRSTFVYGAAAIFVFIVYFLIVFRFEYKKARRERSASAADSMGEELPTYVQSQSSGSQVYRGDERHA